jgi:hypothetical protein
MILSIETVFSYQRPHRTVSETGWAEHLNQQVGDPCNGRAAIMLRKGAPNPPAVQIMQCPVCLAEPEMDLVSEVDVTMTS